MSKYFKYIVFGSIALLGYRNFIAPKTLSAGFDLSIKAPKPYIRVITKDRKKIMADLAAYTKKTGGSWGIYVYEPSNNVEFGLGENSVMVAASTNKVPIFVQNYLDIVSNRFSRETKITFFASDFESGTGILQGTANGQQFTASYLMKIMMQKSDNIATNMLIRTSGRSRVQQLVDKNELQISMHNNTTTAKAMGVLLTKLYTNQIFSSEITKEMLGQMYKTDFEKRLPKYLPENVKVYHKIGMRGATYGDVGIVEWEHPYIITVFVNGLGETKAEESIAQVSKMVFEFEKKLYE